MSEFFTASELLDRINNNDNRATAKPYLLLLRRKMEKVVDGDYGGELQWVENVTGDYHTADTKEDLLKYLRDDYYQDPDYEPEYSDITKIYIDYYEDTVNVFLTDKGYQDHLAINQHNLGKHDTYGIHAFRNKEISSIFNIIEKCSKLEKLVDEMINYCEDPDCIEEALNLLGKGVD